MSVEYWNKRYKKGKRSGTRKAHEWVHQQIEKYLDLEECEVLDVGCGDLHFWKRPMPERYRGIDFSEEIVNQMKRIGGDRFVLADITDPHLIDYIEPADVVLCMNVLYHQMTEEDYRATLINLNRLTKSILFLTDFSFEPWHYDRTYQAYYGIPHVPFLPDLKFVAQYDWPVREFYSLYVYRRPRD